jgi:predicted CoA-substrate-specific enzyme activase
MSNSTRAIPSLGIDVGSTTVKVALLDPSGAPLSEPTYTRSVGRPLETLAAELEALPFDHAQPLVVGVTGSGRNTVRAMLGLSQESLLTEIYAHAHGAWLTVPEGRTIIDIGGQDNKIIRLHTLADGSLNVADFVMNELCAAGTGSFLEMHATDLGFPGIEEFALAAAVSDRPARIAGRCSVLAHSDVVHLRQGGTDLKDIAAGLCRAVVRNVVGMVGGKALATPILFQGGVASNAGVVRALREELELTDGQLIVPRYHKTMGAIGAAVGVAKRASLVTMPTTLGALIEALSTAASAPSALLARRHAPLERGAQGAGDTPAGWMARVEEDAEVVLGIDVGSASVKVAGITPAGDPAFAFYALHEGHLFETLHRAFVALQEQLPRCEVRAVSVTGSGRDLVSLRVGADLNLDEISAQAAGALLLDPGAEAIFEIGGQDSKFIGIRGGHLAEFEMNRICAAGTGAFVLEASKVLGAKSAADMDALAFSSESPAPLSSRCCVFGKSDMVALLNGGRPAADVAAGVFYSVGNNYLNLVVGRHVVRGKVLFLGGLARSSAAMQSTLQAMRPDLNIVVPEGCEVSGALGAAELARRKLLGGEIAATRFRGLDPKDLNEALREFVCNTCSNACGIKQWETSEGERLFTGSVCGRFEGVSAGGTRGRDFVAEYLELVRSYEQDSSDETGEPIGVARALLYFEQGPLWLTYLRELGYRPVVSDGGPQAVKDGNRISPINMVCLPIKVLLGQVQDLHAKGVRRIFHPTVIEFDRVPGASKSENCMLIQASADSYLRTGFSDLEFIVPVLGYEGTQARWREALIQQALDLGADRPRAEQAVKRAEETLDDFVARKAALGREFLDLVDSGAAGILLVARDYTCIPELSMGIPRHLTSLGAPVAPLGLFPAAEREALSTEQFDLIFKSSQNAVTGFRHLLEDHPGLFPVVVNQFLCRQDSCVIPFLDQLLEGKPSLRITLDENVGEVGIKTRCTAFWQVVQEFRGEGQGAWQTTQPFFSFTPNPQLRHFKGVVWLNRFLRFYSAAYLSLGIPVKFFPEHSPEFVERGRRYFPSGEPCLPFLREIGQLERLLADGEFDPERDIIHVAGTRHCASTTLPGIYKKVCEDLGYPNVRIVSPREGFDVAEGVEAFGTKYVQNVARALFGEQYLNKLLLTVRPYEVRPGEADRVFDACLEDFYRSFVKGGFFGILKRCAAALAGIEQKRGLPRPKILVTGEYVVRNDRHLNDDLHRRVEELGGEALGAPLFSDYSELLSRRRPGHLWRLGQWKKAAREAFLLAFLRRDIQRIKEMFRPHMPDRIEPDPGDVIPEFAQHLDSRLDPVLLLEFYQCFWNMRAGQVSGIVNVHPFGCSISTAVEPLLHSLYAKDVPVLSLSFDGQSNVHTENRLAAFMECVGDRLA